MPVSKSPLSLSVLLTLLLVVACDAQTPAAQPPAETGIRYLEPSYSQNDVDIGALTKQLRRLGVEIPVEVQGKVSFSLKAGIPWNALSNGDAYRFDGSITSERLVFGPVSLTNFEAKLLYRKGVLSLSPLRFDIRLADTKGTPGALIGTASIDFHKNGLLTAAVELRDIPWADILELFLIEGIDLDGRISGTANFRVPIQQMYDPKAMAGRVELRSGSVRWEGLAATGGEVDLTLARGLVTLKRFVVELPVGLVTGTGTLDLTSMRYQAEAQIRELALATAAQLAADNLPIAVGGTVDSQITAEGNLSTLSYLVRGSVFGENLVIGTADGVAVDARFSADSKKVSLARFRASLLDGTVDGSADYLVDSGQWQAVIEVKGVSIPRILRELIPKPMLQTLEENLRTLQYAQGMEDPIPTQGQLAAKVTASGQTSPFTFAASGNVAAKELTIGREKGVRLDLAFDATEERITVPKFSAAILGGSVIGKTELRPGEWTWNGSLSVQKVALARGSQFLPHAQYVEVSGEAAADLEWKGTLDPLKIEGSGALRAAAVQVQGIEIPQVEVAFAAAGDRIDVSNLHALVLKGSVDGTASVPMDFSQEWRVHVTAKDIDVTGLNQSTLPIPVTLDGRLDAGVDGTLTAFAPGKGRQLQGKASFQSELLRVDGIPIHQLKGNATAAGETVRYEVTAGILDGRFALAGTSPVPMAENANASELSGSVTLQGLQLVGLSNALGVANRGVSGQIDAALQYSHQGNQLLPEGSGRFEVRGLRYENRDVARSLQGDVTLRDGQLELRNFGGSVFGGSLRTSVSANLREWNGAGLFAITLEQAQLPAIAAFVPSIPQLPGSVRIEARGRLGTEIFAMGTAGIRRTEYESLQVESIQVPFELRYALNTGRGRVAMRESSLHFAGGRVQGSAEIDWYQSYNVTGDLRFYDVHLDSILKQFIGSTQFVSGRISGNATIRGERLRDLTDAAVQLRGQLKQTTAKQLPIISKLLPYFGSLAAGSPAFDTGSVEAIYTAGKLTVRNLELDGPSLRMKASGTVLANGRINLEVMAASGPRSLADRAVQAVATKFLVAAVPPLAIVEANELLQDRVVYLVVTGTITAPIVRVRPVPTLGAETIRFFLKGI